jgi:hypothetical protein
MDRVPSYKSFTRSNYRHNLEVKTGFSGRDAAGNISHEAHHIFPQKESFQKYFDEAGINIHDPDNMVWWEKGPHKSTAKGYNDKWQEFFDKYELMGTNPTKEEILQFGKDIAEEYDLGHNIQI